MKANLFRRTAICAATLVAIGAMAQAQAGAINFTPLNTSGVLNAPNVGESSPFLLAGGYSQGVIVDQLNVFTTGYTPGAVGGGARWGNWDMLSLNETGPDAGRYMFIPHEINGQGVSRYDFQTNTMVNLAANNTVLNSRLDPSRWTPWGTVIAGDESQGGSIFEIQNPLAAPAAVTSVRRLDVGRVAFEGISRAPDGNWYYGDESGTGAIFKYVPKAVNVGTVNELVGGQIFAMKLTAPVNNATSGNKNGSGTWVALNNADGSLIAGIPDPKVDARVSATAAGATGFNRPEDSVIRTLANGNLQYLITVTSTHSVIAVEIDAITGNPTVTDYANRSTIDLATGVAVGSGTGGKNDGFSNVDNIALGPDGNIYVVEDDEPLGGDIFALVDLNDDGDVLDIGEGFARFASLLTNGSEPTGLLWDNFRNQWLVNVQHPTSGNGMTVALKPVPVPAAVWLFGSAVVGAARLRRRSRAA